MPGLWGRQLDRRELLRRVGRLDQVAGVRLVELLDVEPTTNRDAGRWDARERGELIELEAGKTRSYELEMGVARWRDRDCGAARGGGGCSARLDHRTT